MSNNAHKIKAKLLAIFSRYVRGKASAEEQQFVDRFYDHIGKNRVGPSNLHKIGEEIKSGIDHRIGKKGTVKKMSVRPYLGVAASFLIIGALSFVVWYYQVGQEDSRQINVVEKKEKVPLMTVGEDQHYELTETFSQQLSYVTIDDQKVLVLADLEKNVTDGSPRRISNPTKQVFSFLLSDGTQVRLNANAYVEFGADFGRTERLVNAGGDVFFDVKKQFVNGKAIPFLVKTPLQTIEVLGTQFSVNAENVQEESVVLLEGKVKLVHNTHNSSVILSPGQKAHLKENERIFVTNTEDTYKLTAWRKKLFHFEGESVAEVMEELSQWYEQPIEVSQPVREIPITGMISRYENVEEVLQIIEATVNVKFVKTGGKIYVTGNN